MVQVLPSTAFLPRPWGFPSSSWACPLARWWPNTWQLGGFLGLGSWQSKVKVASFYLCFCPRSLHWIFWGRCWRSICFFWAAREIAGIDISTHKGVVSNVEGPIATMRSQTTDDMDLGSPWRFFVATKGRPFHPSSMINPPVVRCLPSLVVYGSTPKRFPWVFLLNKGMISIYMWFFLHLPVPFRNFILPRWVS